MNELLWVQTSTPFQTPDSTPDSSLLRARHAKLQTQQRSMGYLIPFNSISYSYVLAFILNVCSPLYIQRFACKYRRRLQHISRHCDRQTPIDTKHRTVVVTGCYRQPRRTSGKPCRCRGSALLGGEAELGIGSRPE
jgi:hypothetical protein